MHPGGTPSTFFRRALVPVLQGLPADGSARWLPEAHQNADIDFFLGFVLRLVSHSVSCPSRVLSRGSRKGSVAKRKPSGPRKRAV